MTCTECGADRDARTAGFCGLCGALLVVTAVGDLVEVDLATGRIGDSDETSRRLEFAYEHNGRISAGIEGGFMVLDATTLDEVGHVIGDQVSPIALDPPIVTTPGRIMRLTLDETPQP